MLTLKPKTILVEDGVTKEKIPLDAIKGDSYILTEQDKQDIAELVKFESIIVVSKLPEVGIEGKLYLVSKTDTSETDIFDEYIWVNNKWEFIGSKGITITTPDWNDNDPSSTSYIKNRTHYDESEYLNILEGVFETYGTYRDGSVDWRNDFVIDNIDTETYSNFITDDTVLTFILNNIYYKIPYRRKGSIENSYIFDNGEKSFPNCISISLRLFLTNNSLSLHPTVDAGKLTGELVFHDVKLVNHSYIKTIDTKYLGENNEVGNILSIGEDLKGVWKKEEFVKFEETDNIKLISEINDFSIVNTSTYYLGGRYVIPLDFNLELNKRYLIEYKFKNQSNIERIEAVAKEAIPFITYASIMEDSLILQTDERWTNVTEGIPGVDYNDPSIITILNNYNYYQTYTPYKESILYIYLTDSTTYNYEYFRIYRIDDVNVNLNNSDKLDNVNPTATGSFSLNRKNGSVVGKFSTANGYDCEASGMMSYAEGIKSVSTGWGSHAEGDESTSVNMGSHAEGRSTASGSYSHSEGYMTTSQGTNSHAEGEYSNSTGQSSHAEGHSTASGRYSHSEGDGTEAKMTSQHVQGQYNIPDNTSAHIVGWGELDEPKNIHTLDTEGNAWFEGDVYVGSTNGVNKDAGSKKLATEEYVDKKVVIIVKDFPKTREEADNDRIDPAEINAILESGRLPLIRFIQYCPYYAGDTLVHEETYINDFIYQYQLKIGQAIYEQGVMYPATRFKCMDYRTQNMTDGSSAYSNCEAMLTITPDGHYNLNVGTRAFNFSDIETKQIDDYPFEYGKIEVATKKEVNSKQTELISGINIKTINGEDVLGSGNIEIKTGNDLDVQINGTSIVQDGVANIPVANSINFGVTRTATQNAIDRRSSNYTLPLTYLDYGVKAAMCDGKGAAWSEEEKASARERLGISEGSSSDILMTEAVYLALADKDPNTKYEIYE